MSCPTSIKLNALRSGMSEAEADAAVKIVDIIEATFPLPDDWQAQDARANYATAIDALRNRMTATPTGICK